MKKYIITVSVIIALLAAFDLVYYRLGWFIDFSPSEPVTTFTKTDENEIYLNTGKGFEQFEIKGVNMGSGIPGEWSTDFAIDKETYIRWFGYIQEMGANTLRIYTVQDDVFYDALYEYNSEAEAPLWIIHGVWVNDYIQNSHRDAYDEDFYGTFLEDCKTVVDVIHGKKKISLGRMASAGSGSYTKDVSQWVIGYILGVEWEDVTVIFTDEKYRENEDYYLYKGKYMYTTEDATPFEAMLARVGDKIIEYESKRYKQQRLIAFSNWPTTDPFVYPQSIRTFYLKCAQVDVEHIKTTEDFLSGQFASYHVYPYYPDYLNYTDEWASLGITDSTEFINEKGELNTYKAYLSLLTKHHSMPVIISEFGVSTGRGMAQVDENTGRNQGNMSEKEQGQALMDCYYDIMDSGCAGCCIFSWQDEWFKRTWNTMYAINLKRTPYWSDYQTNEQYFGLLSFDPGEKESICYVDGDISEWIDKDVVFSDDSSSLSVKYDEKFIYFLAYKKNLDFENESIYIPIDTTPKTGSNYCQNYNIRFDRQVDFVIAINGSENSRVQVQERYEVLKSTYSQNVYKIDAYVNGNSPDKNSPLFVNIDMILKTQTIDASYKMTVDSKTFETGKLTYGNANPNSDKFNSLADFISNGDYIEIKIPWQLLNFADPSKMTIHDDYYDGNFGIEFMTIDKMYAGISCGTDASRTHLAEIPLEGWDNKPTSHERLKSSYNIMQKLWTDDGEE